MREIGKYRGMRVDNSKWVYGCYGELIHLFDGEVKPGIQVTTQVPSDFDRMIPVYKTELIEVIPNTVGEYSGVEDINKINMCEDDIVLIEIKDPRFDDKVVISTREVVEYKDGAFGVRWGYSRAFNSFNNFASNVTFEVLGNIYENPDLIENDQPATADH